MLDTLALSAPVLAGNGIEVRLLELDRLGDLDMAAALALTATE